MIIKNIGSGLRISGCLLLVLIIGASTGCNGSSVPKDENQIADEMVSLISKISDKRYPDSLVKRFNQVKSLGCLKANFQVAGNLPEHVQKGVFAHADSYEAEIRFANASKEDDSKKDLRGMSIKVFGVKGTPLWGKAGVQDFLLNSYPALFAATPKDFLQFIRAVNDDRVWWYFINPADLHLGSLVLLLKARENPASPFDIRYWSTTPFQLGDDDSVAVKYSVQSCSVHRSTLPETLSEDYLSVAMQEHLKKGLACFDFMVQLQTNPDKMPIEDASVIWDENVSPFIKVATITVRNQDFRSEKAMKRCEQQSFNPWQTLPEHKPLGGINRVRNKVYSELSEYRKQKNQTR